MQLIDLARNIPPSKEYIVDTVHFNGKGSELVAKLVVEKIEPIINSMSVNQ
ncbi:MAG: lysophospholipase L1-like esterase [Cocleimonas sp.]